MKKVYIIGIILCAVFGLIVILFANEVESARYRMYDEMYYGSYSDDAYWHMRELSEKGALLSLPFIAYFILAFSFTFKYIKRVTAKVMSIIGVSISGLVFLITLLPVADPGSISFDEFAPLLIVFILIMIGFSIVNLVQANRNNAPAKANQQTLDDMV